MNKKYWILLVLFSTFFLPIEGKLPFDKVIIWGYKLHSHTHSYIHWGYYRAFKHMGYETYWVDNNDGGEVNPANALIIFMGNDQNIPLRDDCFYIIHNGPIEQFKFVLDKGRAIVQQVYTHDVLGREVTKLDTCLYYSIADQILYMPWATDLLPHEIDIVKKLLPGISKKREAHYIGTVWDGTFGNRNEIELFRKACNENGITLKINQNESMENNISLIQTSYLAPALQGSWQCEKGYIPCRIFKNISYGQFGITNNKTVFELFEGKVIYDANPYKLFYTAQEKLNLVTLTEQYELMDMVRDKHTYINRIETLLWLLEVVYLDKNR